MLNYEQQLVYIRNAKNGDENSKNILFNENSPLIKSIIRRFINKGIEYEDLFQIACIGFIKALNNFDEKFNVKFSTYSVPMIIGEIKRYIRDNGSIKVSRTIKILANKINRFIDEYNTLHNIPPTIEIISQQFNITSEEVVIALDSSKMPISIFDKFEEDEEGQQLIEKLPFIEEEDKNIDRIHLSNIIEQLDNREKHIVWLRYFRDQTQSEVAKSIGVSQVQISRIENKILEKIRLKY